MKRIIAIDSPELWVQNAIGSELYTLNAASRRPFGLPTATITENYNARWGQLLIVDCSSGNINIHLPRITSDVINRSITVKRSDSSANVVNIYSASGQLINGATFFPINVDQGAAIVTVINRENWAVRENWFAQLPVDAWYYTASAERLLKKVNSDGTWVEETLPGSSPTIEHIDCRYYSRRLVGGTHYSGNYGYLAYSIRNGPWIADTTFPLYNVMNWKVLKVLYYESMREVFVLVVNLPTAHVWRWTEDTGWVRKYIGNGGVPTSPVAFVKSGGLLCLVGNKGFEHGIYNSYDQGATWHRDNNFNLSWTNPERMDLVADMYDEGYFHALVVKDWGAGYNTLKTFRGASQGKQWQEVSEYDPGSAVELGTSIKLSTRAYNDGKGHTYAVLSTPDHRLVTELESEPVVATDSGMTALLGPAAISDTEAMITGTVGTAGYVEDWDGDELTTPAALPSSGDYHTSGSFLVE